VALKTDFGMFRVWFGDFLRLIWVFLWLICIYYINCENDYQENWGEGWEGAEGRGGVFYFLFYIMYTLFEHFTTK